MARVPTVLRRSLLPWSGRDEVEAAPVSNLGKLTSAHPEYENLPEGIKAHVSLNEFLWMGQTNRDTLFEAFTEPEYYED